LLGFAGVVVDSCGFTPGASFIVAVAEENIGIVNAISLIGENNVDASLINGSTQITGGDGHAVATMNATDIKTPATGLVRNQDIIAEGYATVERAIKKDLIVPRPGHVNLTRRAHSRSGAFNCFVVINAVACQIADANWGSPGRTLIFRTGK